MMPSLVTQLYSSMSFLRWAKTAWTIDQIDSPIIADFHAEVIKPRKSNLTLRNEQILIQLIEYFKSEYIFTDSGDEMSSHFYEELASLPQQPSITIESFTKVKKVDLIYIGHDASCIYDEGFHGYVPLLTKRSVDIPEACKEHYNVRIDLWYYQVMWRDVRVKEEIDIKLVPYAKRWKLGISR